MIKSTRRTRLTPSALRVASLFTSVAIAVVAAPERVSSQVTRVVIDPLRSETIAEGRSFGAAGPYERLVGFAYGELDPNDPRNAIIQDIDKAPRNARGKVEYATSFALIKPTDLSRASGLLYHEVVNRGNEGMAQDEFLMSRGAIILRNGWQGDISPDEDGTWGGRTFAIRVPTAIKADGSSITGPVLLQLWNISGSTSPLTVLRRPMAYRPASLDTREATLISMSWLGNYGETGRTNQISPGDWAWADCSVTPFPGEPDPTQICLREGFDPELLYQLVFTAQDPLVLGIGFAATRDVASFFRHAPHDDGGGPNPIAGVVTRAIGTGRSQTGQYVRTFINLGFNEDLTGLVVWDGAIPDIAGRQLSLNVRFALPDGTATLYAPDTQGALSWGKWEDAVRGHSSAGLLERCQTTGTCPKIFETFGSGEMWGLRMSGGLVGTDAAQDIPLPDNVRRYYSPGTTHGGGPGGFDPTPGPVPSSMYGTCTFPGNPNSSSEMVRALIVALDDWITLGTEPPPSRYPRLSDGTLVPDLRGAVGFPDLPGVPLKDHFANPVFDYDFGPMFAPDDVTGVLTKLPPIRKAVMPAFVPRVNEDGNEIAGVPSVLHQAPLGTYMGWNIVSSGFFAGQRCAWVGSFVPFARTRAERLAAHDPRPSLEERYGTAEGYVAVVRAAVERLVQERFLLREDGDRLILQASEVRLP